MRRAALLAALLLSALGVACGGGDSTPPTATPPSSPPATTTATSPAQTPTPPPGPTDTPAPNPPTPTPPPAVTPAPAGIIEHGDRSSNMVALTFDMGGRVEPALDIMQFLVDNDVPATIFLTGAIIESPNTEAGRQVLGIVCDTPGLFEPANHSYSHPDFRDLSPAAMEQELATTEAALLEICATSPRPLFRPPFGGINSSVASAVAAAGYPYVIMWDIDTIDWRPESEGGPAAADITAKVLVNAGGGSIVLMHLGGYNTLDALPAMVDGLRADGFQLVNVSTLLGLQP